jgi:hypothetical protein
MAATLAFGRYRSLVLSGQSADPPIGGAFVWEQH